MPQPWTPIPIANKMFQNVKESVLTSGQAAIENAYINEAGAHARFPGLVDLIDLPDNGRVYLNDWRGDLMAATSNGRLFRVDTVNQTAEDVTAVPISGGRRVIFSSTTDELLMAAGGPPIRFAGVETEVLSKDAPDSTHIAFIDSYVIVVEKDSGRFHHSPPGVFRTFDPLDVFTAESRPDNISAAIVTKFRELIMGGTDSLEQFERLGSGDTPFFRRWTAGEGISEPYTMLFADNALAFINQNHELVRVTGQTGTQTSGDVQLTLEQITDWTDAWTGGHPDEPLNINGQRFILLQVPNADTPYGTKGLTFLYDYRQSRWSLIYGWDDNLQLPTRWPGWSHWPYRDKTYVGCEGGKICYFDPAVFSNSGMTQRMMGRTAHLSELGEIRVDNLRARLTRGVGTYEVDPQFSIRARRDNGPWTRWVRKGLGLTGKNEMYVEFGGFGSAHTWQFEWQITDDAAVDLVKLEAQVTQLG